jgi:hypothetical protein
MTEREHELTTALACHVRLFSFEQITRTWWQECQSARRNAQRRLKELCERQLITRLEVQARPLLPLTGPLVAWCPGLAPEDFSALAWKLWKRWQEPPVHTTVFVAGSRLVNRLGGVATGTLHNLAAVSHDLHVSEVYLCLLRGKSGLAQLWVGEDVLAPLRVGQKLPDAILHDGLGQPQLVIEFGGAYPPERLRAFHEDCEQRVLPYEIW